MAEILDIVKEKLSSLKNFEDIEYTRISNYHCVEIPKESLLDIAKILKSDADFDQLIDIAGVDRFTKEQRFETVYNLWSSTRKTRIFLRVKLDSKEPEVESLTPLWSSADWLEREAFDMFGIIFLNHPDLRRIFMMDDFRYYPLRKDYPLMGIPGAIELPKK
jgi:NADH-quinone oxidoreductase subunit C